MTVAANRNLVCSWHFSNTANLKIARGTETLDAMGLKTITLTGFPDGSTPMVCGDNSDQAPTGILSASYDATTGHLSLSSSEGASDSGATVHWMLMWC